MKEREKEGNEKIRQEAIEKTVDKSNDHVE
jgi:hypothetical protein